MSYSNFNTFKLFENVGINSSSDYALSMEPNGNNISFHSSNSIDYNNVDIMSIKNIINKKQNEDLNLSSLNGTTINPVITINNNHSDCRIMTNLNVSGNLNVLSKVGINTSNPTEVLDVSGNIKSSGSGSFDSINCGNVTYGKDIGINGTTGDLNILAYSNNNYEGYLKIKAQGGGHYSSSTSQISNIYIESEGSGQHTGYIHLKAHTAYSGGAHPEGGGGEVNIETLAGIPDSGNGRAEGKVNIITETCCIKGAGITPNTKVGINTDTPSANLHVGTGDYSYTNYGHWYGSGGVRDDEGDTRVCCAIFDNIVKAEGYVASSDSRIKTNITDVPDNLTLQQLRNIPCRYYEYIDKVKHGSNKTIGFIAQEVKTIMPMATIETQNIIPNVYKIINCTWTSNADKFIMNSNDLPNVSGVKYKFYVSNTTDYSDEKEIEITGNSDNTFTFDAQYTNVFCYGSEVDDFHTLDKNKLFTLNFSATQEIDRIQQTHITEIASLKTENQEQQNEINALKTENAELKSIIDKLKTANSFEEFKNSL